MGYGPTAIYWANWPFSGSDEKEVKYFRIGFSQQKIKFRIGLSIHTQVSSKENSPKFTKEIMMKNLLKRIINVDFSTN
jgi:hypothetical protein